MILQNRTNASPALLKLFADFTLFEKAGIQPDFVLQKSFRYSFNNNLDTYLRQYFISFFAQYVEEYVNNKHEYEQLIDTFLKENTTSSMFCKLFKNKITTQDLFNGIVSKKLGSGIISGYETEKRLYKCIIQQCIKEDETLFTLYHRYITDNINGTLSSSDVKQFIYLNGIKTFKNSLQEKGCPEEEILKNMSLFLKSTPKEYNRNIALYISLFGSTQKSYDLIMDNLWEKIKDNAEILVFLEKKIERFPIECQQDFADKNKTIKASTIEEYGTLKGSFDADYLVKKYSMTSNKANAFLHVSLKFFQNTLNAFCKDNFTFEPIFNTVNVINAHSLMISLPKEEFSHIKEFLQASLNNFHNLFPTLIEHYNDLSKMDHIIKNYFEDQIVLISQNNLLENTKNIVSSTNIRKQKI